MKNLINCILPIAILPTLQWQDDNTRFYEN